MVALSARHPRCCSSSRRHATLCGAARAVCGSHEIVVIIVAMFRLPLVAAARLQQALCSTICDSDLARADRSGEYVGRRVQLAPRDLALLTHAVCTTIGVNGWGSGCRLGLRQRSRASPQAAPLLLPANEHTALTVSNRDCAPNPSGPEWFINSLIILPLCWWLFGGEQRGREQHGARAFLSAYRRRRCHWPREEAFLRHQLVFGVWCC